MLECNECGRKYSSPKGLAHHTRQVHAEESKRTCSHCGKVLASTQSRSRHEDDCPELKKQVWISKSVANTNHSEENRHIHIHAEIKKDSINIIKLYKDFLATGGTSTILTSQKRKLSPKSVETYAAHLNSYFSFLEKGTKSSTDLVSYALKLQVVKEFLQYLEASNYAAKTILNRIFALQRLMGFFYERIDSLKSEGLTKLSISNPLRLGFRVFC
jgi:phage FluMu protein Com